MSIYRSDIDGLRALAVLGVVLFHLNKSWLPGGFTGVDIFFVISGFVITKLILDQEKNKIFDISDFYWKRVKRIVPAYIVMVFLVLLVGYFLFIPSDFERLGGSILHALSFVSNFFFWSEAGYFDVAANSKPLLHTWTLAVEGQFYLIYPLVLIYGILKLPQKIRVWGMLVLIVIFCFLSQAYLLENKEGAFFLTPFRFFEFLIGGILVFVPAILKENKCFHRVITLLGLMILFWVFIIYSNETRFPGVNALLPTLGTALLIYSGTYSSVSKIYNNGIGVWVGKRSYSLYLYHWPVIVFFTYMGWENSSRNTIIIVALFFLLSIMSYRFIERPLRRGGAEIIIQKLLLGVLMIGLLLTASYIWKNDGWKWRFDTVLKTYDFDLPKLRDEFRAHDKQNHFGPFLPKGNGLNLLVVGDSHAVNLASAISLNKRNIRVKRIPLDDRCFGGVLKKEKVESVECKNAESEFSRIENFRRADVVVFAMLWNDIDDELFKEILVNIEGKILNPDVKIIIMGKAFRFQRMHSELFHSIIEGKTIKEMNEISSKRKKNDPLINEDLKAFAKKNKYLFIDTESLVCPENRCSFLGKNGALYFWDRSHWTLAGAKEFGSRLINKHPEIFISSNENTP